MTIFRLFLFCLFFSSLANQAFATVNFSIKGEDVPRTKVLFFGFDSSDVRLKGDSLEILERIKKNLKTTDLFEIVRQNGQFETAPSISNISTINNVPIINNIVDTNAAPKFSVESAPNFEKYGKTGIGAIVVAQFSYSLEGNLELRIRMWDVLDQRQLFGKFYTASRDNYRKVANIISDEIFKAITGEKSGNFNTQIVYIAEYGSLQRRTKRIALMDFDGENPRFLTDGNDLVLTPSFSRKKDEIFYLRWFERRPQIFALDIKNMRSRKIGGFRGTTFAAAINPKDSNLILLTAIFDGNSDIYEMNIDANSATRLTKSPAIDTTASYSPDGKYIAFSSDRDAGQQIYIMDSDGTSVKRISSGGGSYSKPVWSPDGKLLAFTRIKSGQFYIGVMSPTGKGEKLLTSGYLVEGAKWSPNGRYLIYSKKRSAYGYESMPRLFVIDIITGFEFEVPTRQGEGATDPDWS
jgi:TolB protein